MAPNSALATCIVNSASCLWKDESIADFTVEIEDTVIRCHRFILAACSRFFYVMFTTDMKEKKDNSARLHDTDLSAFELILKVIYTGEDVVNENNVVSIWQCAHRLQIPFLVKHCEKLSVSVLSMENYVEFYKVAKVLDSEYVLIGITDFMIKNFRKVKEGELFLEISADELIDIIQSDALDVSSEDDVLFSIFKWVERSPKNLDMENSSLSTDTLNDNATEASIVELNHETQDNVPLSVLVSNNCTKQLPLQSRSVHLESLIKASRSCLASPYCLQTLYRHRSTQSEEGAKNVIFDAILYQVKGYRHGFFPTAAMQRNCSEFEHVGVICYNTGIVKVVSLARNKWHKLPDCSYVKNTIKIALFDSSVYAVGSRRSDYTNSNSCLCVLKECSWTSISELPELGYYLLSHETFLYVFNASNGEILRMQPNSYDKSPKSLKHPEDMKHSEFALSFSEFILVFSKDSHNDIEETVVHVLNSRNETWHRLENLTGPAKKMVSFQDGEKMYILQSNGNLWRLTTESPQMIAFQLVKKLWNTKERLRGALLYKDKLFLCFKSLSGNIVASLPGVYNSKQIWTWKCYVSSIIFTITHKKDLKEECL